MAGEYYNLSILTENAKSSYLNLSVYGSNITRGYNDNWLVF